MYVVEYKPTGEYLTKGYWRGSKKTQFMFEAHRFTAFELKLASVTVLINRKKYKVWYLG